MVDENSTIQSANLFPTFASDPLVLALAVVYGILLCVGICGNSYVVVMIRSFYSNRSRTAQPVDTAFIYISFLCTVDFLVIGTLPMTISYLLLSHWLFGPVLCKVYWTFESAGKILSTFVLTALSWDRYCGICQPNRPIFRSKKAAISVLVVLTFLAFILLAPLPYFAETETNSIAVTVMNQTRHLTSTSCHLKDLVGSKFFVFIIYIFITGYCIPLLGIAVFYSLMLLKLRKRFRSLNKSRIPLKQIAVKTLALVIFYFACWTPYWICTQYFLYANGRRSRTFVYIMSGVHALPYVNSAFNWVFYALLNTQLKGAGEKSRCSTAGGLVSRAPSTAGEAYAVRARLLRAEATFNQLPTENDCPVDNGVIEEIL